MALHQESVKLGNKLFRWRSYLPLLFLLAFFPAYLDLSMRDSGQGIPLWWDLLCFTVALFGLAIRVFTIGFAPVGTSGRNTHKQVAEELNTTGIYSIVRNPLYFGNFFMILGVMLFTSVWYVPLIFVMGFWLYYERIILAEEDFLSRKFGQVYDEWANRTRAFWPQPSKWQPAATPFIFRRAVKREHNGLLAMIVIFFIVELYRHHALSGEIRISDQWLITLGVGAVIFLVVEALRKTSFFHISQTPER